MPQRFSMALLMMVMVRMVSSANPPSVSATRGNLRNKTVARKRSGGGKSVTRQCAVQLKACPESKHVGTIQRAERRRERKRGEVLGKLYS